MQTVSKPCSLISMHHLRWECPECMQINVQHFWNKAWRSCDRIIHDFSFLIQTVLCTLYYENFILVTLTCNRSTFLTLQLFDSRYQVMYRCWLKNPDERPTFADLVNKLELIINPPPHLSDEEEEEPVYMNVTSSDSAEYLSPVTSHTAVPVVHESVA